MHQIAKNTFADCVCGIFSQMSTNLSHLLGKKSAKKRKEVDKVKKNAKRRRLTKEEREANELQRELLFEQKYKCDYDTYVVQSVTKEPSQLDPHRQVAVIKWLNDRQPPAAQLRIMGQKTQRLAVMSRGVQSERQSFDDTKKQLDWLHERSLRSVTSSVVGRLLAMAEPYVPGERRIAQSQQTMLERAKLVPAFAGNELTRHGTRMEPFARRVYMQEHAKQSVVEVGFIQHASNRYCGASPDGITIDGSRLVELKCPKKRSFQVGDPAPLGYWHQCQLQMEVCDVDQLDYFEARHMRRPRGLRTNCVYIRRDKRWFASIVPIVERYDRHLKRLCKLRSLFPDHMFVRTQHETTDAASTTKFPKLFKAVQLCE